MGLLHLSSILLMLTMAGADAPRTTTLKQAEIALIQEKLALYEQKLDVLEAMKLEAEGSDPAIITEGDIEKTAEGYHETQ